MKPGVRVCMILQDQMMMEEPKYLREAKRSETHEEVLLKMMKKIGIEIKPMYEQEEQQINRENKPSVSMIASPYACSLVRQEKGVVIYDIEGYSLIFLPDILNDKQLDLLQMKYANCKDKIIGYSLVDNRFYAFGEDLEEKKSYDKLFTIIENAHKKGMKL